MLSYENCPNNLPCMPDYRTLDGVRLPELSDEEMYMFEVCPTLVSIGLLDAILEVEKVLAWNQTEKHPNAKWKSKPISWHDSKAVSHLSKGQLESLNDEETGISHRAHACCRLLMSLAHELNGKRNGE